VLPGSEGVVKDQPAGAKRAPVLAVRGKGRGITQGFPQELWMGAGGVYPKPKVAADMTALLWLPSEAGRELIEILRKLRWRILCHQ